MSDTTGSTPAEGTPDTTPTEALQLADQEPIAAAPAAPAPSPAAQGSGGSHTRTILEVIGGVVAVGLIVMAGAVGFAVGHVTGGDDGRLNLSNAGRELRVPMPGGEGQGRGEGQGQGQGQPGMPGELAPGEQRYFEAEPGQPGMPGQDGFGGRGHQDGDGDGFMGHDDDDDGFMGGDGMMPQDGTLTPQG